MTMRFGLRVPTHWWRDEASYTRPEALLQALAHEVLPHLTGIKEGGDM
jgi:hypothetical protein